MKDLNFLMGNHTDLETAKLELKKQYAISDDIWDKIKGCEESLKGLSNDRKSTVTELMINHPYVTIVSWFMEKREALSREITDKVLFSKSQDDKEDFASDLEVLFTRLEDTLISKYYAEPKIQRSRIKKVIQNFPLNYFYDALDGINNLVPIPYTDELPYLNGCTHYIKGLMA